MKDANSSANYEDDLMRIIYGDSQPDKEEPKPVQNAQESRDAEMLDALNMDLDNVFEEIQRTSTAEEPKPR